MSLINVTGLTAGFEDPVFKNISFSVEKGEIFAITGPSGCGKTTLLNHMITLLNPIKGRIEINGLNVVDANEIQRAIYLKNIGVMYQSGALFGSYTLLENVCLPLEEWTHLPKTAIQEIALNKLQRVNLLDAAYKYPSEISGGMKKRAAIARAMALDPSVLFLDEPAAGLDPVTRGQLDDLILQLSKTLQLTFVIVTHEISTILSIADKMIMLHDKQIIANGKPSDICQQTGSFVETFFKEGWIKPHE